MSYSTSRRRFIKGATVGTASLWVPAWLSGCVKSGAAVATTTAPLASDEPVPANPFLDWFGVDEDLMRGTLGELTKAGADRADLYFQYTRSNQIGLEDGIVSKANSAIDEGVGLRTVIGDQTGYAYTEDLTPEAVREAARTASAIAHRAGGPPPPQDFDYLQVPSFYELKLPWGEVGIDKKLPLLRRVEEITRGLDPAVKSVRVWWSDSEERVLVADARGHVHTDLRPQSLLWVSITAEKDGVTQSHSSNVAGRRGVDFYTEEMLQKVAREAVDRTMLLFEATRPPAGEMPVVLAAGASGILLHEAIGHGMEADFNRKGISIYADMIGKKVAPDFVTVVDSGVIEGERGALNFDDEGNPCQRTVLVDKGTMVSYLHDDISAAHYGVEPTGSGRRQSFRYQPMPRMRCTYMENGPHKRDEIISSVKQGIVAETFTNGQVQIGAGDFTFYIKNGWLIEDGKITAPIKDCNIIGNGPEALRNVTMAADDLRLDKGGWTCGKNGQSVPVSQGLPTVLVSKMTVGGVHA